MADDIKVTMTRKRECSTKRGRELVEYAEQGKDRTLGTIWLPKELAGTAAAVTVTVKLQ